MSRKRLRLGLLDFGWVNHGQTPLQSLRETFATAKLADRLEYARFWISEHHLQRHAYGSPQVLAGILAAKTRRIRIGIGAVLLHYWSPLKVAEDSRLLETLFPGRIDMGVGRGRADNIQSHRALLDGRHASDDLLEEKVYRAKLDELVAFLEGSLPWEHPYSGAAVIPEVDVSPEIWVCGSETAGPQAARAGLRFCCSLFHGRVVGPKAIARYRSRFKPSKKLEAPQAAVAVCGVCADTEAEAQTIRESFSLLHRNFVPTVVGTPSQCKVKMDEIRSRYDVDEILFLDMAQDRRSRMRSIELLAHVNRLSLSRTTPARGGPARRTSGQPRRAAQG